MPQTIGFHLVKSGYGLWLPGDERGHWSDAWDAEIGYHGPHTLHEGDPVRRRMAAEQMSHPPVRLSADMIAVVVQTIARCTSESPWRIVAGSVEATHTHLLITYSGRDIHKTAMWLGDQTTKAIHRQTPHAGPVWCKGKWCSYLFDLGHWNNTRAYIERHNVRRGLEPRPYAFISD